MKFSIAFAAVLAVAAAQYLGYTPIRTPYVRPTLPPLAYRPPSTISPIIAANRVVNTDANANILRYDNDIAPDGSYAYAYETDNGIAAQEKGTPRNFGGNPPLIPVVAEGSFSYISPEGERIETSYIADENGFQPSGNALPTPPPIPEAILRSLEFIARNGPQPLKK